MIGVALGGGGARGVAHLGVLRHLEEINLRPDIIAGTSAGSIVATLYAFGFPLDEIKNHVGTLKPTQLTDLRWGELGLMENSTLRDMLTKQLGANVDIKDAKIPLAIHVTDLISGIGYDLLEGSVIDAVLASCTVPGLYIPPTINDRIYVDGGLTENVPFRGLKALGATTLIGINLNGHIDYNRPENALDVLMNAMDIAIDSQTRRQLEYFDLTVSIDLTRFSRTSAKDSLELQQAGYEAARKQLPTYRFLRRHIWKKRLDRFVSQIVPDLRPVRKRLSLER